MEALDDPLIIAGTMLPLIGTGLTVLLAIVFRGFVRWLVLALLPGLTMVAGWLVSDYVWANGNMLAAALYLLYLVIVFIYYFILTVTCLVIRRKRRQRHTEYRVHQGEHSIN